MNDTMKFNISHEPFVEQPFKQLTL